MSQARKAVSMRRGAVAALLVAHALVGCGGAPAARTTPERTPVMAVRPAWERSPVALLPRDAIVLVHVDGRQLRASPWWGPVSQIAREVSPDEGGPLTALVGALDEAWVALREPQRGSGAEQIVGVARGADIDSAARAAVARWLGQAVPAEHDGLTVWEGTSGGDALRALRFDAHTWAGVLGGGVDDMRARARAAEPGDPLVEAGFDALAARMGWAAAPIAVLARVTPGFRRSLSAERMGLASLDAAERLGLRVDPSRGLVADLTAEFAQAEAAARASDELTGVVSRYASNPMVAMMGFADILARIEVRVVATRVEVRVSLTEDEVRTLLERFGPMVGAALAAREEAVPHLARSTQGRES